MANQLSPKALGLSIAVMAAACMLLLSIGVWTNTYTAAAVAMQEWRMFYDTSLLGTITGMIEAGIWSFIIGWVTATLYNRFT